MEKPYKKLILAAFLILIVYLTYSSAYQATIVNNNGDDKSYLVSSNAFSQGSVFSDQEKWDYFYFHIHKPLIIPLMAIICSLHLTQYWFLFPYLFYLIASISVLFFLRGKINDDLILYGSVSILVFNSVFWYFGVHLLPDVMVAGTLAVVVLLLDRTFREGMDKKLWYLTALACLILGLFRLEMFAASIVPIAYYIYQKHGSNLKKKKFGKIVTDRELLIFIGIIIVGALLFFFVYLSQIEKGVSALNYPGILLTQIGKSAATIKEVGQTQGNFIYVIVETILSYALLPSLVALFGMWSIIKRKKKSYYPVLWLFIILLIESSILGGIGTAEQRYTTRFFPLLTVFVALGAMEIKVKVQKITRNSVIQKIAVGFVFVVLIYSSYYLIHKNLDGYQIAGYPTKMLVVMSPADVAFKWDRSIASRSGYLFIRDAIRKYPYINYDDIYTNVNPASFQQYIKIIEGKNIYKWDQKEHYDAILILLKSTPIQINATMQYQDPEFGAYVYVLGS